MEAIYTERRGERRCETHPCASERRVRERRTGIEVREISDGPAHRALSLALARTSLSPLDQAIFEMVHALSVERASLRHSDSSREDHDVP
jgi:hypothetical protein